MGDSNNKENKPGFFKTVSSEFKKIVWPSKEATFKQSVAVTLVSVAVGIIVVALDFFIQYGVDFLTK